MTKGSFDIVRRDPPVTIGLFLEGQLTTKNNARMKFIRTAPTSNHVKLTQRWLNGVSADASFIWTAEGLRDLAKAANDVADELDGIVPLVDEEF